MKFTSEIIVGLIIASLYLLNPSTLSFISDSILGRVILVSSVLYVIMYHHPTISFVYVIAIVLLLHRVIEGMDNKENTKEDEDKEKDNKEDEKEDTEEPVKVKTQTATKNDLERNIQVSSEISSMEASKDTPVTKTVVDEEPKPTQTSVSQEKKNGTLEGLSLYQ